MNATTTDYRDMPLGALRWQAALEKIARMAGAWHDVFYDDLCPYCIAYDALHGQEQS